MGTIVELIKGSEEEKALWQWDTGRQVKIVPEENTTVDEVHFSNVFFGEALVVEPKLSEETGDITADIPNILLQYVVPIDIYIVMHLPNGECTTHRKTMEVRFRKKPSDYVYTETEIRNYEALEKRIRALEEGGGDGGVSDAVQYVPQTLTDEQKTQARANISKFDWKTFSDSYGTYTYAILNNTIDYDIAQSITNTSDSGTISALEDIVSWISLTATAFMSSEPATNVLKNVVLNYNALVDGGAITGSIFSIAFCHDDETVASRFHLEPDTTFNSTHFFEVSHDNFQTLIYYNADDNTVKKFSCIYKGVSNGLTTSGMAADAKVVGDKFDELESEINDNTLIKPLPITEEAYNETVDKLTLTVNVDELEANMVYKANYEPHNTVMVKYVFVCTDGTRKTVSAAENADNLVRVTKNDAQGFISVAFDNYYHKVTYGDKSTADVVTVETSKNQKYLDINNSTEFVPTSDYQPATKKYVDSGFNKLSSDIEGLSVFVTPQMFGAVADGSTDDTEAIQKAFDVGGNIYFPAGRYKVTSQLAVTRPCKISMYKPYPCTYQADYPLTEADNHMGARIETYATDGYGILIGDGVEIDGFYMRAMDSFEGVLFKFDGTLGHSTYPSRLRLAHIILDNNSIYTVPEAMFDFVPNETYFHILDDITIGSLRGRQFCEYGFRAIMTTTDNNWANSVRIRNLCIDILADYPLYIEGGAKGAENWVFENPSIQTYPYDVNDETYIGKSGHIDIVTLKNMQNPLILGGDIYDLHAASYGRIFNIVNTPNISCYGSNKFDEIDTNLTGKLQKASDNLNISMLKMSVSRNETTGDSTLVLTDGTREKSILLPSATMTDEQINNGVGKWLDENSEPVVTIGKNKFNVLDSNTVNGEYYFLNGNLVFESNSSITTTHFIEAEENDKITVSLNGSQVGFYAILYYDKDKNALERVSCQSAGAVSHTVTNTETAYVRLLFTQGTLVYADRESTNIMVLVNNETDLTYEAYTETLEDGTFTKIVEESVSDYFAENSIDDIIENKAEKSEVAIYVTPEMFGAVGDGVTDDSVAIQKAIDEAGNTYPVYLSKKNYKISTGLVLQTNYTNFRCDGIITYDGVDSAITLTNIIRSTIYVSTIYAENGTAVKITNENGYVKFNDIKIDNIHSCKVGIHITTPSSETQPIYYNKISFMDIIATEIGINIEPIGYLINENRYYGGTIGGGCFYGIKIGNGNKEDAGGTNQNKFLSGGIEGIADDGYGIYIEDSSYNIFRNIRALERYGLYVLGIKGISIANSIELPVVNLSEVDISELGDIGNDSNVITVMRSSFDGETRAGERIEINGKYGFVYDTKKV